MKEPTFSNPCSFNVASAFSAKSVGRVPVKACKQGSAPITAKYRWFLRAISTVSSIHVKDTGPPVPSRLPISHQAFQV